jgi:hypothetical protein
MKLKSQLGSFPPIYSLQRFYKNWRISGGLKVQVFQNRTYKNWSNVEAPREAGIVPVSEQLNKLSLARGSVPNEVGIVPRRSTL